MLDLNAPLGRVRLVWLALVVGVVNYAAIVVGLIAFGITALDVVSERFLPFIGLGVVGLMYFGLRVRRQLVAAIPREATVDERIQQYSSASIVGLALAEGAGLMLITFSLMTSSMAWAGAGGAATVGAMLLQRPSEAEAGLPEG